jgi:hypothetical protein
MTWGEMTAARGKLPSRRKSCPAVSPDQRSLVFAPESCYDKDREDAMSRLQALLLALELSAIVWIGMFICAKWIVDESDVHLDAEITSAVR